MGYNACADKKNKLKIDFSVIELWAVTDALKQSTIGLFAV